MSYPSGPAAPPGALQTLKPKDAMDALKRGVAMSFQDPELKKRIMVSIAVNALAFMAMIGVILWGTSEFVAWALEGPEVADPSWLEAAWYWVREALRWLLYIVVILASLLYSPVLFTMLASILLPAFHGPVFEAARSRAGGPEPPGPPTPFFKTLGIEIKRLLGFAGLSLIILPLNFVPVIGNVLYLVIQFYLSARTMGWDLMAYHFELHGMDMIAQQRFVARHRSLVLSLGAGATLLAMIPLAQIVFITTNVAGAGIFSAWMDGAPRTD